MSKWDGRSKGTPLGYRIFIFLIRHVRLPFVYKVLSLVTFYYYLFARTSRRVLTDFYDTVFANTTYPKQRLLRQNFSLFGQILVDRVAFLLGKGDAFKHTFENEPYLRQINEAGQGGILLSAHVGNWETAGNLLKGRITPKVNILMLDAEVESIKSMMQSKTGGSHFSIIPIKDDLSHIFELTKALQRNELVAMHADRYVEGMRFLELPFFNRMARFPYGPFALAVKLKVPVTFVFAVKSDTFNYHLSATRPLTEINSPKELAQLYIQELEKQVRSHPEQWFNYFPFFVDKL